ncbi:D-alanyl-D-alanine carboxypeptidase family protein [Methylicorpusculum sp.]|uniref:D-alanyl-D-alanine carboxypeptidase family protein n=1 Tax=Methylicorpusculum sp. TaxID=2713644 RepID=UPI0027223B01|nr:D-alanyl-D-alanine carboxypeptidase family protein [Methylicorpusculum sp.]MDO8843706.1 D-alanyl-D-alanine carboxypeptidase family protein [Methylicorpusculum sp.]
MTLLQIYRTLYFFIVVAFMMTLPPLTLAAAGGQGEDKILIPPPPTIAASSHILIDANSGRVLAENNADSRLPPASLTKIMAVYVAFNELSKGHLQLDENVNVSPNAWRTPGSRMFIEVNKQVTVSELLHGVIIQSGNDASVALAEHIAGDESTFAEMMNQQAARLGLTNTHFTNSMGLPNPEHYTSARDLGILTRALIKEYPEYYKWFSLKEFTYNKITQRNRNKLLWSDETVDGVKTGHTEEAGFCLVASAVRDNMRLISVAMGTKSERARTAENRTLLNYGFRFYETHHLYKGREPLKETRIWKGDEKLLQLGLADDLYVTIPRRQYKDLKAVMNFDQKIFAPVKAGDALGSVNVSLAGEVIADQKLIALSTIEKGNLFRRIYDAAILLVKK